MYYYRVADKSQGKIWSITMELRKYTIMWNQFIVQKEKVYDIKLTVNSCNNAVKGFEPCILHSHIYRAVLHSMPSYIYAPKMHIPFSV